MSALNKENPTEEELKNAWYLQSSNYRLPEGDNAGAGMKIDLGLGHIDAYNFKLTSNNVLIDSNPKSAKDPYFEIKAKNELSKKLETMFKVSSEGARLATWTVDENSIRTGTLGAEKSMWLCSTGTKSKAALGFVGNKWITKDGKEVEVETADWYLTIGEDFGVS